ncbi:MAG: hypothetical protein EHJ95_04115 [Methanobacteriota archaeon]|nr:MAG: hypothetical protein EHJ95_04115 [Euryarchaeota archaeon]
MLRADSIEPPIVFEPNKDYVNRVLEEQIDLAPSQMEFVRIRDLPDNWASFLYQAQVNAGGVPSEYVVAQHGGELAERANAPIYQQVVGEMIKRMERIVGTATPTTATPGV